MRLNPKSTIWDSFNYFNMDYTTKSKIEAEQKNQEMMYQEMKKMKESGNDKSVTDGNINKSG